MKKDFDCVGMKREIQAGHRREAEELIEEEAKRRQWQRVLPDPILAKSVWKLWPELSGKIRRHESHSKGRIV